MTVTKRDGREVEFDKTKISDAICKAIVEVDGFLADDTKQLAYDIADRIAERTNENLSIEQIQNMVEVQLMLSWRKDIAKAYILYRNERTKSVNGTVALSRKLWYVLIQRLISVLMQMLMNLHSLDVKKRLRLILAR